MHISQLIHCVILVVIKAVIVSVFIISITLRVVFYKTYIIKIYIISLILISQAYFYAYRRSVFTAIAVTQIKRNRRILPVCNRMIKFCRTFPNNCSVTVFICIDILNFLVSLSSLATALAFLLPLYPLLR